jgi:hypothetical protein
MKVKSKYIFYTSAIKPLGWTDVKR